MIAAATGKQADLLAQPVNLHTVEANANSQKQLTIQEILENHLLVGEKMARCLCLAKIIAVLEDEGWYYNCCSNCARKARLLGQNYYNNNCA
ncbi:hypothetical protein DCAR_0414536 [Daucus carota subsp. sativus]|uniref:Uncharacterized protein n=1 Tax=Daucus carota subsp. sativus TaxID=79200 RepID=A0A175YBF8_DAUCS|nr:hypothetical protein DCAR_0414536 [Daucus carota subsp. sativus]